VNVCVPSGSYTEILSPLDGTGGWGFVRQLGHEGEALMNEISVPIKETPENDAGRLHPKIRPLPEQHSDF
jgi:hypothetical protein